VSKILYWIFFGGGKIIYFEYFLTLKNGRLFELGPLVANNASRAAVIFILVL